MYDLSSLEGKKILVTGGSGSIGYLLVKVILLKGNALTVRILSNDEDGLHSMGQELSIPSKGKLRLLLGDIRDKERLVKAAEGIDIIFHLAALKHVYLSEYNPFESVNTNVIGTQNIIDAAIANDVDKVILSSSDKAANPSSVLGATKLLSEKLITAANMIKGNRKTTFSSIRFGNVLGSRGSVLRLLEQNIRAKRRIGLTHPDMTRFVITPERAISSLVHVLEIMQGGEVFVFKMPSVKVSDLFSVVLKKHSDNHAVSNFETLGVRPGEKIHEDLITEEESYRTIEMPDLFILVPTIPELCSNLTYYYKNLGAFNGQSSYSSREPESILTQGEILKLLSEIDAN